MLFRNWLLPRIRNQLMIQRREVASKHLSYHKTHENEEISFINALNPGDTELIAGRLTQSSPPPESQQPHLCIMKEGLFHLKDPTANPI